MKYLEYVQEVDLTLEGAMTDTKGARRLRPHQPPDPEQFVYVVKERSITPSSTSDPTHRVARLQAS